MNIYKALPLNNLELNIKTIYFTDAYLKNDVINPVTQKVYTKEEKENLELASLTAPRDGFIAIESYKPEAILWFNEEDSKKIVSHLDSLNVKEDKI